MTVDELKLGLACKLAKQTDNWTVGALVSYACENVSSEEVWNWTVDDLRNYVYDSYVNELVKMGSYDELRKFGERITGSEESQRAGG